MASCPLHEGLLHRVCRLAHVSLQDSGQWAPVEIRAPMSAPNLACVPDAGERPSPGATPIRRANPWQCARGFSRGCARRCAHRPSLAGNFAKRLALPRQGLSATAPVCSRSTMRASQRSHSHGTTCTAMWERHGRLGPPASAARGRADHRPALAHALRGGDIVKCCVRRFD